MRIEAKGHQSIIKTKSALNRKQKASKVLHLLMLEEPENHLSHSSLSELIATLQTESSRQMIIATHSSLIASRLDLRNIIMLSARSPAPASLSDLESSTVEVFYQGP